MMAGISYKKMPIGSYQEFAGIAKGTVRFDHFFGS